MPLFCRAVGEDCELTRRLVQTGELQARIERGAFAAERCERLRIAALEAGPDGSAACFALDDDEAPGLAQPDGRRGAGKLEQPLQRPFGERRRLEPPDVPPPPEEVDQFGAKIVREFRA